MAERHKQSMGREEQMKRQSNEMTVYGAHGGGHSKQKVIAFVGVMPFHVGEEFETIETSGDFSNLNRENVTAIIVGNQDLNAEQLHRFNNLQVVLPLNPLHSSQELHDHRTPDGFPVAKRSPIAVGLAVLDRARRFQFDIVFYDPSIQQGMEVALGVKRASTLRVPPLSV
uniref:Uncharacterized protein n=1 Tax=Parascaris equorum TaxID=6256 RepID=A0A914RN08_PAREQ